MNNDSKPPVSSFFMGKLPTDNCAIQPVSANQILSDLTHARCAFQLRTITAILGARGEGVMADHSTEVTFRGEQRSVSFEYEGDGVIVWCFDGENTCHGEDTTETERQEVYDQLWAWITSYWEWCNDAD